MVPPYVFFDMSTMLTIFWPTFSENFDLEKNPEKVAEKTVSMVPHGSTLPLRSIPKKSWPKDG
jgi:hypothetical protein